MQYIFLLYAQESGYGTLTEAEKATWWGKINAYNDSLVKSGHYKMTSGLHSPSTAKTLTRQGGKLESVDGPFAETKEQLLGFFLIDCDSLDEAIEYAKELATDSGGTMEVRPVMVSNAALGSGSAVR